MQKAGNVLNKAQATLNKNPKFKEGVGRGAANVAAGKSGKQIAAGAVATHLGAPPTQTQPQGQPMAGTAMSRGGVTRKGGSYYLHKGEKVVSKRSVPKVTRAMKKAGMTLRHKGRAVVKKVPFIPMNKIRNMANGGTVLKNGMHLLKPGQRVIPASKVAKARKAIKAAGCGCKKK